MTMVLAVVSNENKSPRDDAWNVEDKLRQVIAVTPSLESPFSCERWRKT
jgi:hypothetical protein